MLQAIESEVKPIRTTNKPYCHLEHGSWFDLNFEAERSGRLLSQTLL